MTEPGYVQSDPTGIVAWLEQQLALDEKLNRTAELRFKRAFLRDTKWINVLLDMDCPHTTGLKEMAWRYRGRPGFKPEWTPKDVDPNEPPPKEEFQPNGEWCMICSYERDPEKPLPYPFICPHTGEERRRAVLRLLWNTLTPNNLAHQPDGYQLTGHLHGVKVLPPGEAIQASFHRDMWNEAKGFQRGLAYAIYYLDLEHWHDAVDSVVILTESMKAYEAHIRGEEYEINGFPYTEGDFPEEEE